MARISDIYAGQYMTAAQLAGKGHIKAQIALAAPEMVGQAQDQREKCVLSLRTPGGQAWPRRVVLNKTNGERLAEVFGDDPATWTGQQIEIWSEPVQFGGRTVPGIKVAPMNGALPAPEPPANAVTHYPPQQQRKPEPPPIDDELPF